jgi:hypothetical protein
MDFISIQNQNYSILYNSTGSTHSVFNTTVDNTTLPLGSNVFTSLPPHTLGDNFLNPEIKTFYYYLLSTLVFIFNQILGYYWGIEIGLMIRIVLDHMPNWLNNSITYIFRLPSIIFNFIFDLARACVDKIFDFIEYLIDYIDNRFPGIIYNVREPEPHIEILEPQSDIYETYEPQSEEFITPIVRQSDGFITARENKQLSRSDYEKKLKYIIKSKSEKTPRGLPIRPYNKRRKPKRIRRYVKRTLSDGEICMEPQSLDVMVTPIEVQELYDSIFSQEDQLEPQLLESSSKIVLDPQALESSFKLHLEAIKLSLPPELHNMFDITSDNFENVIALLVGLYNSTSLVNAISLIFLYIKTNRKQSLICKSIDIITEQLDHELERARLLSPQASLDVLSDLKSALLDVNSVKNSKILTAVRSLIQLSVMSNMTGEDNIIFELIDPNSVETLVFETKRREEIKMNKCRENNEQYIPRKKPLLSKMDLLMDIINNVIIVIECCINYAQTGDFYSLITDDPDWVLGQAYLDLVTKLRTLTTANIDEARAVLPTLIKLTNDMIEFKNTKTRILSRDRDVLDAKIGKLMEYQETVNQILSSPKFQRAPFSIQLVSGTGTGKSTVAQTLYKLHAHTFGLPDDEHFKYTLGNTKYYDSLGNSAHTFQIDDAGQTKSDKLGGRISDPDRIIQIVNNVVQLADMADLSAKGKVLLSCQLLIITSNTLSMGASELLTHPAAMYRRIDISMELIVKDEFKCELSGSLDLNKIGNNTDLHLYTLRRAVVVQNDLTESVVHEIIIAPDGTRMERQPAHIVFPYIAEQMRIKRRRQDRVVERMLARNVKSICEHDVPIGMCPTCLDEPVHENIAPLPLPVEVFGRGRHYNPQSMDVVNRGVLYVFMLHQVFTTQSFIGKLARRSILGNCLPIINMLPIIVVYYFAIIVAIILDIMTIKYSNIYVTILFSLLLIIIGFLSIFDVKSRIVAIDRVLAQDTDVFMNYVRRNRAIKYVTPRNITVFLAILGAIKISLNFRRLVLGEQSDKGILPPIDHYKANVWTKPEERPPLAQGKMGATTVQDRLNTMLMKKMAFVSFHRVNGTGVNVNALPICSDLWLTVNHAVEGDGPISWLNVIRDQKSAGYTANFRATLDESDIYNRKETDISFVLMPSGGNNRDLRDFYLSNTDGIPHKFKANMIIRRPDGTPGIISLQCTRGKFEVNFSSGSKVFQGISYTMDENSQTGTCAGVITYRGNIIGIHNSGRTGYALGAGVLITRSLIDEAVRHFNDIGKFIPTSKTKVDVVLMGQNLGPIISPHGKSFVHDMQGQAEYIGSLKGARRIRNDTKYTKSPISEDVEGRMGIPVQHQPPNFRRHNETLKENIGPIMTHTTIPNNLLNWAKRDLISSFHGYDKSRIMILSMPVVLNGLDRIPGVNSINKGTSRGLPFNGPKVLSMIHSDEQVKGVSDSWILDDTMNAEYERLLSIAKQGKSLNVISQINQKDDPAKCKQPNKMRIFNSFPFAFNILIRQYMLSMVNIMMENPLLFSSAVGVNCFDPIIWESLFYHVTKHPGDNYLGGDYSKFDKNMNSNVMSVVFEIILHIHRDAGYTEEDLTVITSLLTELLYPIMLVDTELFRFTACNSSGNPLTVIINNIANCLYMRCTYVSIMLRNGYTLDDIPKFDKYVAMLVYGDDVIAGIHEDIPFYNHCTISKEFASWGIKFTMADKDKDSIPYIPACELSFLKRKFTWNKYLSIYNCPIEEESIAKMLHMFNRGSFLDPDEQIVESICNANNEYFQYGKEIFLERHEQLKSILVDRSLLFMATKFRDWDTIVDAIFVE